MAALGVVGSMTRSTQGKGACVGVEQTASQGMCARARVGWAPPGGAQRRVELLARAYVIIHAISFYHAEAPRHAGVSCRFIMQAYHAGKGDVIGGRLHGTKCAAGHADVMQVE